ncbi:HEAT repeat domain-containing protein [candidate division WOR-3 bacterium]|nr:HEAT repeat domain-containing protein [candidate division WOR-3 bacterium]
MAKNWLKLTLATILIFACQSETARLRRQLTSSDPELRARAAKRLGELKDKPSVPLLLNLLEDSMPVVRFEAGLALGNIGDPQAIEPLFDAIQKEPQEDIAMAFTKALSDLGSKALDHLIILTSAPRRLVRMTACRALGRIGSNKAVDPLIPRLNDPDPQVRKAAISALRRIGDPKGMDAIARKLASPDYTDQEAAEQALGGSGYEEQMDEIRSILRRLNR